MLIQLYIIYYNIILCYRTLEPWNYDHRYNSRHSCPCHHRNPNILSLSGLWALIQAQTGTIWDDFLGILRGPSEHENTTDSKDYDWTLCFTSGFFQKDMTDLFSQPFHDCFPCIRKNIGTLRWFKRCAAEGSLLNVRHDQPIHNNQENSRCDHANNFINLGYTLGGSPFQSVGCSPN